MGRSSWGGHRSSDEPDAASRRRPRWRPCRRSSRPCTARTPSCRRPVRRHSPSTVRSPRGVQPLDEGGRRQRVATGRSVLDSATFLPPAGRLEQDPGNRTRLDEVGVGGRDVDHLGPDDARVLRVLPRGANRAALGRVGAEEMSDELPLLVVEQGGLWREEGPGEATARGQADVVLGADGVAHEERHVPRWHLDVGGHGRRRDIVGIGRLGQGDREGADHEQRHHG